MEDSRSYVTIMPDCKMKCADAFGGIFSILLVGFVPQLLYHRSVFFPLPVSRCLFLLLTELGRVLPFGTLRGGG